MADEHKSDMVMRFMRKDRSPVLAECVLEKDERDPYMLGFKPQTYDTYSNFFEIKRFDFSVAVKDKDSSKEHLETDKDKDKKKKKSQRSGNVEGAFASWRSANNQQAPNVLFPLQFDKFTFERLIDAASPVFFQACCTSQSFDTATLVKRVSTGGNTPAQGFLKIVFSNVLITSLDWDDGEMTTEKCEFVCRKFVMQYRQQIPDGSFEAETGAKWDYLTNALPDRSGGG